MGFLDFAWNDEKLLHQHAHQHDHEVRFGL